MVFNLNSAFSNLQSALDKGEWAFCFLAPCALRFTVRKVRVDEICGRENIKRIEQRPPRYVLVAEKGRSD